MEQKTFPIAPWLTTAISEELHIAHNHIEKWLYTHIQAAKKIAKKVILLFPEDEDTKKFLHLPATLIGAETGYLYAWRGLEESFPKDTTLIECIILTGILKATGLKKTAVPTWSEVIVNMNDIRNILIPGKNFSRECNAVIKKTASVVVIQPYNKRNTNDVFVFSVLFDFEKDILDV